MKFNCTVCGFDGLDESPAYFTICPCCGTEFGYDDFVRGHDELLAEWIVKGMQWHSSVSPRPAGWEPIEQLVRAGLVSYQSVAEDTRSEIGIVELGTDSIVVPFPAGNALITTVQYAVGNVVDKLMSLRLSGAAQTC